MPDNRINPLTVANAAEDARLAPTVQPEAPAVSPTGLAIVPPKAVPYLMALVAVAGAVLALPTVGITLPAAVLAGAGLVVTLGTIFGLASPGLRKPQA